MTPESAFQYLQRRVGETTVFELHADPQRDRDPWFRVDPSQLRRVALTLRDDPTLACNYLECVTGIDYPSEREIHVVYHVYSTTKKHRVVMKAFLDRDEPKLSTLSTVWSTANWQERECFDLLGVLFEGHPDLRRLLLPDDWVGHPLRKDYGERAHYHGIPTTRANSIDLFAIKTKPAKAKDDE
jgi:NADH-quinone oxidoreductase subunit C